MPDKLLLLFGDWLVIKAEGTTAILVAGIIAGYAVLLLSTLPISRQFFRSTDHKANNASNGNASNLDQHR